MTTPHTPPAVPDHVMRYLNGPVAEDRQFDFLIGDWSVQATRWQADGSVAARYAATWTARSLNDGRMVMDNFQALAPDGRALSSFVTLRTYCHDTRRWEMAGLAALQPAAPAHWSGVWVDGQMRLLARGTDSTGRAVQTKICFSDITPERFCWTSAHSTDDGATWVTTASLVAQRRAGG